MDVGSLVTREYKNFRGVDFRGEETDPQRSPDAVNLWRDYRAQSGICTRPRMKTVISYQTTVGQEYLDRIGGVYSVGNRYIVHRCYQFYLYDKNWQTVYDGNGDPIVYIPSHPLNNSLSVGFFFLDRFYIKDATHYIVFDPTTDTFSEVEGYVPTTSINRNPDGSGGETYMKVNLLTDFRINTFVGDGVSNQFFLDVTNFYDDPMDTAEFQNNVTVMVNGEDQSKEIKSVATKPFYIVHMKDSAIPPKSEDGSANVIITFKIPVEGAREKILNCPKVHLFDNRVFFYGNPAFPNTIFHSELDNPTYVSDLSYYREGLDEVRVTGMASGNNALWVFREASDGGGSIFYHVPTIDYVDGKVYPYQSSNVSIGCVGGAVNFGDDICFLSARGMEGISGDITSEQVVAHRSTMVDRLLTESISGVAILPVEWEGYLILFLGNKAFAADSRSVFSHEGHREYDWFYWELPMKVTAATVIDGSIYVGSANGIYQLTREQASEGESGGETSVHSHWTTGKDSFGSGNQYKSTNKRGCVIEAEGAGSLSVKTDRDGSYEEVASFTDGEDSVVCRINKKKFKDIQLRISSESAFRLEAATLECFIGGYLKR